MFETRLEGGDGASQAYVWGKAIQVEGVFQGLQRQVAWVKGVRDGVRGTSGRTERLAFTCHELRY